MEIQNIKTPKGLEISTMSVICKLNTVINIQNINKHMPLSNNNFLSIKLNNDIRVLDKALIKRKKKSKKNKKNKSFYNQITTIINVDDINKINIKLFINGSIQMTGCKSITDSYIVLNKLIDSLKSKDIEGVEYINSYNDIKITYYRITLINSDYKIKFKVITVEIIDIIEK